MSAPENPSLKFDQRYFQNTGHLGLVREVSRLARRRVHCFFIQAMRPGPSDRILDIGTSDVTGDEANMLEQLYPHQKNLTCASLSNGESILRAYPQVNHVQIIPGKPLPFETNAFDIAYSNAVLEHVGSRTNQKLFLDEMCRVAPRRFLAVPNRCFPIEHHTCLPLLHYLPKGLFRRLLRGTRYDFWSHETNLNYLSAGDLRALWPGGRPPIIARTGVGFGFWKSNLLAYQP